MFNKEKEINVALYILNKLGKTDFHKLFKILYFAEQKHLVNYGSQILGDTYIAMQNGPVPSNLYDILKTVKGEGINITDEYKSYFDVTGFKVSSKEKSDLEYLSESEIECLDESISENKDLTFPQLTAKSHGFAYKKAGKNDRIKPYFIAAEANPGEEMLKYIKLSLENQECHL